MRTALTNGFSTILKFVSETSHTLKDDPKQLDDPNTRCVCSKFKFPEIIQYLVHRRFFVCATVRILAAWLSEETTALRDDVCEVLEFVVTLSVETFEAQKVNSTSRIFYT